MPCAETTATAKKQRRNWTYRNALCTEKLKIADWRYEKKHHLIIGHAVCGADCSSMYCQL